MFDVEVRLFYGEKMAGKLGSGSCGSLEIVEAM